MKNIYQWVRLLSLVSLFTLILTEHNYEARAGIAEGNAAPESASGASTRFDFSKIDFDCLQDLEGTKLLEKCDDRSRIEKVLEYPLIEAERGQDFMVVHALVIFGIIAIIWITIKWIWPWTLRKSSNYVSPRITRSYVAGVGAWSIWVIIRTGTDFEFAGMYFEDWGNDGFWLTLLGPPLIVLAYGLAHRWINKSIGQ